ncbi:protease complex subunit PrcB family protein [Asanoa iriomotensis]|uniref:PrcB C-terminal domain-containing protein n=1 Tax=Asanoa iriomotensis TaxID=234613 RepID=A0ABQ4C1F5_9ACTN|nr:protease complex subunit PrcB family protein [Asanoa iriomotensis]GIF56607.1 hypothetical protein Air01nite_27020 [Asanoa iriomotensis]
MVGPAASPIAFRSLFLGCAHSIDSSYPEAGLFLVRTEDEWVGRWTTMTSGQRPAPQVPAVDWASELVVMLALGWRPTGGYSVIIEQVAVGEGHVRVSAWENRPWGFTTQAITFPVHAVAVPAHDVSDDLYLVQRITTTE